MLRQMGIEDERCRLEWISAAEGDRVRTVINDMVAKVRALGPFDLKLPEETLETIPTEEITV
jgi:F420-non-reducing hydrogenase iron-sulfur subunit